MLANVIFFIPHLDYFPFISPSILESTNEAGIKPPKGIAGSKLYPVLIAIHQIHLLNTILAKYFSCLKGRYEITYLAVS
jgi:hypothetical protein